MKKGTIRLYAELAKKLIDIVVIIISKRSCRV